MSESETLRAGKKKWNLKKKMKSQKKSYEKISEHSQCQCQIMSESS